LLAVPFVVYREPTSGPSRRCEVMTSSAALRFALADAGVLDDSHGGLPDGPAEIRVPGVGRAVVDDNRIEYELEDARMQYRGTAANLHQEQRGHVAYANGCAALAGL
jgi:hypothetical protein